jgi:hypothetical protein
VFQVIPQVRTDRRWAGSGKSFHRRRGGFGSVVVVWVKRGVGVVDILSGVVVVRVEAGLGVVEVFGGAVVVVVPVPSAILGVVVTVVGLLPPPPHPAIRAPIRSAARRKRVTSRTSSDRRPAWARSIASRWSRHFAR